MTSRERIEAALNHREPDRTPMFEYVLLPPIAEEVLGHPYVDYAGDPEGRWLPAAEAMGWEKAVRRYAQDRLELARRLGHDMLYVCPNPVPRKAPAPPPASPEPVNDDPVARVRRRNELAEQHNAPLPEEPFLIYRVLKEEMAARNLDLPMLAPAYAHGVWTDVDLMQTMLLEPEVAHRHYALCTERSCRLVDKYVELGIEMIGVGGDFAGNRPLISPAAYRTFIMPEVRAVSRHAHGAGRWAVNASDGDLWSVIDDFLLGCEVDGYLEIDQGAGMELPRLKARFGDRITFFGNIDCGNLLSFASPADIRAATHACLAAGQGNGGHIFCVSNAVTGSVPMENYLAMVNAYREYFGLGCLNLDWKD